MPPPARPGFDVEVRSSWYGGARTAAARRPVRTRPIFAPVALLPSAQAVPSGIAVSGNILTLMITLLRLAAMEIQPALSGEVADNSVAGDLEADPSAEQATTHSPEFAPCGSELGAVMLWMESRCMNATIRYERRRYARARRQRPTL